MMIKSSWWPILLPHLLLCTQIGQYVAAYPSGAPVSTCNDLVPKHLDFLPQISPSPYFVQPAVLTVKSGDRIKVMMSSQDQNTFLGFMMQAKSLAGAREPVGTFVNLPTTTKTIACGNNAKQNTATHRDRNALKNLELEWEAPSDYEGPVTFNSTFVQNGATFWVGIESEPIQVVKRSLPNDISSGISTTKSPVRLTTVPNYTLKPDDEDKDHKDPIYKGCGSTKSCFGIPDNCVASHSCLIMGTAFVRGETFEFELMAKNSSKGSPKYVALGLSRDQKMGGDSVTECALDPLNKVNAYMSYNVEGRKDNIRLNNLNEKISLKHSKFADGTLYCKFERVAVTVVEDIEFSLIDEKFYLLLASGTGLKDGGRRVGWHDIGYESSSSPRYLAEVGSFTGSSDILYRLHGAFMATSWIGLTSVGILLARHFKMTWVGKKFFGKDQWFVWHRAFMVSTWSLTIAAFVMIFIEIQGWYSETSNPHAILGCITTGLAFIQPFGAALRPSPNSPKRPIFNWLHWLVGNCAHILAVVTIFFAAKLHKAELPEWVDWILVAFVSFHVFMHLLFSVVGCFTEGQMEKRVNDFPMKDMGPGRAPLHMVDRKRDAPNSYFRKFLLAIYVTVIVILTALLVTIIVLAPIEEHWVFVEAKKLLTDH